jgi:flagella basal body P-ring formation protein FlgA
MHKTFLILLSVLAPGTLHAATLRMMTTLERPVVRVDDLFDDAGPAADRVLGPGPAPGARIVVEAPQLAAIARQFGVAWRPGSAADRVVIDRPGRELPREAVLAPLRAALIDAGAGADCEVLLPGFTPPLVAQDSVPTLTIEQLQLDRSTDRFTATLAIASAQEPVQRLRLSGDVQQMMDAVVTTHRLAAGAVVGPEDVTVLRVRATASQQDLVRVPGQAIGLAVRHMTPSGQTLPLAELAPPVAVPKGARVTMELRAPGLAISGIGVAAEAGAIGDRIRVLNPVSHAVVVAEILSGDLVRVVPEPAPRAAFGPDGVR